MEFEFGLEVRREEIGTVDIGVVERISIDIDHRTWREVEVGTEGQHLYSVLVVQD
jgi:hypothetical protein